MVVAKGTRECEAAEMGCLGGSRPWPSKAGCMAGLESTARAAQPCTGAPSAARPPSVHSAFLFPDGENLSELLPHRPALTCHSPPQGHYSSSSTVSSSPQLWSYQASRMDFSQHRRMTRAVAALAERTIRATFL